MNPVQIDAQDIVDALADQLKAAQVQVAVLTAQVREYERRFAQSASTAENEQPEG